MEIYTFVNYWVFVVVTRVVVMVDVVKTEVAVVSEWRRKMSTAESERKFERMLRRMEKRAVAAAVAGEESWGESEEPEVVEFQKFERKERKRKAEVAAEVFGVGAGDVGNGVVDAGAAGIAVL